MAASIGSFGAIYVDAREGDPLTARLGVVTKEERRYTMHADDRFPVGEHTWILDRVEDPTSGRLDRRARQGRRVSTERDHVRERPAEEPIEGASEKMPPVPDSMREAARFAPDHWLGMVDPAWTGDGEEGDPLPATAPDRATRVIPASPRRSTSTPPAGWRSS